MTSASKTSSGGGSVGRIAQLILLGLLAWAAYHVLLSPQWRTMWPTPTARFAAELATTDRNTGDLFAFVTGGSSGIGKSMVINLLKRGFSVVFTATREETRMKAEEEIRNMIKLAPGQKVEGRTLDIMKPGAASGLLNELFESYDLRVVVYQASPEAFKAIYQWESKQVTEFVTAMTVPLADGVITSVKHWMRRNVTGTFIGTSSTAAHARFFGADLYGSLRTWQTEFLTRVSDTLLSRTNALADARTRKIMVACVETPFVETPRFNPRQSHCKPGTFLCYAAHNAWNSDTFVGKIFSRILDQGHSFVVEGLGWRIARLVSPVWRFPAMDVDAESDFTKQMRQNIAP